MKPLPLAKNPLGEKPHSAVVKGLLMLFGVMILLLIIVAITMPKPLPSGTANPTPDPFKTPTVQTVPLPPIQVTHTASSAIGDTVRATKNIPCGSSLAALDEIRKWAVLNDNQEMARVMASTHSTLLTVGDEVKILDHSGFIAQLRKVRIIGLDAVYHRPEMTCWVDAEAFE
jgi:hypothetical protein